MKLLKFIFIFSEVIFYVSSVRHWIVTDEGKIQSILDSIFFMKQPHNLLTFLEQEKYKKDSEILYEKITNTIASIQTQWAQISLLTNIENLFYTSDSNCQIINKDKNVNLYDSIVIDGSLRSGITSEDLLLEDNMEDYKFEVPDCEQAFSLNFSMYTFEHLQAMRNRENLYQYQEKDLIQYLFPEIGIDEFGGRIAYGLSKNKTSWLYLNLGALYWRYKGNSYKALECARRAIITAPRKYRDISLLTTGGILHAARHSAEAAIVIHTAINYAPDQSKHHLALGNVYAALGDFKRSLACYDNCLKLSPKCEKALAAKNAILCHQKVEETLMTLHSQLQNILTDLHICDKELETWLKLSENIFREKDVEYLESHEYWPYAFVEAPTQTCTQTDGDDSILTCEIKAQSYMLSPSLRFNVNVNFHMLKNIKEQVKIINEHVEKSKCLYGFADEPQHIDVLKSQDHKPVELFPESEEKSDGIIKPIEDFNTEDWPTESNCNNYQYVENTKKYLPIFPTFYQSLYIFPDKWSSIGEQKFLSWNPPICKMAKNSHNYFTFTLFKLLEQELNAEKADSDLMNDLVIIVKHIDINEIGKRISLVKKSETQELWIVNIISSLYWRVTGNFYEALNCAQSAFDSAPSNLKNIPLINIASILHKFNQLDDALAVVKQALNIHKNEPVANFLYGSLLHIKGNNHTALKYMKRAIKNNLHSINSKAVSIIKTIVCESKIGKSMNFT